MSASPYGSSHLYHVNHLLLLELRLPALGADPARDNVLKEVIRHRYRWDERPIRWEDNGPVLLKVNFRLSRRCVLFRSVA